MPHITIEYVIILPVLILQIFLFPLATNWIMNIWVDSRRTLALQEAANQLGSTIQQIYISMNRETIGVGTLTQEVNIPPFIENHAYTGNATLKRLSQSENSSKALEIMLKMQSLKISAKTSVILGNNVIWKDSTFVSNSTNAGIRATKFVNGTIVLAFTG